MASQLLAPAEQKRGWQPWGALVPFLGIGFVAATVVSLTAVLQRAGLVDVDENPIGLTVSWHFCFFPSPPSA